MGDDWPGVPPLKQPARAGSDALPPSVRATGEADGKTLYTFTFLPPGSARTVSLAGTFNGWNATATPMEGPHNDGTWSVTIPLGPGVHQYKFVVDGQRWSPDPRNTAKVGDNFGGHNSVLRLGRLAELSRSDAKRGDGRIETEALAHRPTSPLFFQRVSRDALLVRYQAMTDDVERVEVTVRGGATVAMRAVSVGPLRTLYEAHVAIPTEARRDGAVVEYTFILRDGSLRGRDPRIYKMTMDARSMFETPSWARDAVWYQIFPDRFRNGDPKNDPEPVRPWTSEWFTPSPWETESGQTFYKYYVFSRFYGGDLKGVEDKLDYLAKLGVNALYFNPVFKADTNHKYNATNYLHVDDHFGVKGDYDAVAATEDLRDPKTWKWTSSDRQFLQLIRKAHAKGLHVIIDGVFNHVGVHHPAFQDVMKNGRDSPYADWFDVTSWEPFRYNGWAGYGELPVFKKSAGGFASEEVTQHIMDVTRRWMDPDGNGDPSDGIDGWRLDVPNEIALPFWERWRRQVKSINPDAYIVGEIWDRADDWLDGRHFDAVMNYEFAKVAIAWVGDRNNKIPVSEVDRRLAELRMAYPEAATYVMQNLVDSHDTDRLVSMLYNPDRAYDRMNRVQDDNPNYNNNKPPEAIYQRARLVALLQMTYVGAPMVYYGDEAGMWGADDPTCRKPMLWEDLQPYEKPAENFVMKDHLAFYGRAIALRRAHPALRRGAFRTLLCDDQADVWAFLRTDGKETVIVVLNASDGSREVKVPLPEGAATRWRGVFGSEARLSATEGRIIEVSVPGVSGVVLAAE